MNHRVYAISIMTLLAALATAPLQAAEGHDHHDHASQQNHSGHHENIDSSMNHDHHGHGSAMAEMFLEKRHIDGYDVSFHVMAAQAGMEHGGSHNLMIKIEQNGKVLDNLQINSKVVHPNGKDESKPLMKMGEWYMNGYDLGHGGKHQLMILFKTASGSKHRGGVYYSAN